jgi:hypothetical protein
MGGGSQKVNEILVDNVQIKTKCHFKIMEKRALKGLRGVIYLLRIYYMLSTK